MSRKQESSGFALVGALVLIILLSVIGVGSLRTADLELQTAATQRAGVQAFYIAEAGLQRAIGKMMSDGEWYGNLANTSDAFAGDNTFNTGYYQVAILMDQPEAGKVTIRSTGNIDGFVSASRTVEAVGEITSGVAIPSVFDLAMTVCQGEFKLDAAGSVINGDVHIGKDFNMFYDSVVNGTVWAEKVMAFNESSSVTGEVIANGEVKLDSDASPAVDGDVTSGDKISGSGTVTGTSTANAPLPLVPDRCSLSQLDVLSINEEKIQELKDNADGIYENDVTVQEGDGFDWPSIGHFKKSLRIEGNVTFDENTILIVDNVFEIGGPAGLLANDPDVNVTVIIPFSDMKIENGGEVNINGYIHIGATKDGGTGLDGGDLKVESASTITINGSFFNAKGAVSVAPGTVLQVNHVPPPSNPDLGISAPGSFTLKQWVNR